MAWDGPAPLTWPAQGDLAPRLECLTRCAARDTRCSPGSPLARRDSCWSRGTCCRGRCYRLHGSRRSPPATPRPACSRRRCTDAPGSGRWRCSLPPRRSRCCLGLPRRARGNLLLTVGAAGVVWTLGQGFAIGPRGFAFESLGRLFGEVGSQYGMGLGAALVITAFAMLFALGLALRGFFKGDGVRRRQRRRGRGAGGGVHVLPGGQDPAFRRRGRRRRLLAGSVHGPPVHRQDLGTRLRRRRHPLRRGVEHAGARRRLRGRLHRRSGSPSRSSPPAPGSATRSCCACFPCCRSSRRPSSSASA